MFGGQGLIGYHYFFLQGRAATYGTTGMAFLAFFLFEFAFADTASTIMSGAMVGRTSGGGDVTPRRGEQVHLPDLGHWIWGPDGWLATMDTPFRDFGGSTVVHRRRHGRPHGAIAPRSPPRAEVQARRRWDAAGART